MNYDDHPDFNKARTPEEATPEFAKARAAMYDRASADFGGGTQDGLWYLTIGGLMFLLLMIATA